MPCSPDFEIRLVSSKPKAGRHKPTPHKKLPGQAYFQKNSGKDKFRQETQERKQWSSSAKKILRHNIKAQKSRGLPEKTKPDLAGACQSADAKAITRLLNKPEKKARILRRL